MLLSCTKNVITEQEICSDFQYSMSISEAIGFVFLGNIYDNVRRPRLITVGILVILSALSLVEAIFGGSLGDTEERIESSTVAITLYQMSSVFESGVCLACIVIIHNWFKDTVHGTVSAVLLSAIYV